MWGELKSLVLRSGGLPLRYTGSDLGLIRCRQDTIVGKVSWRRSHTTRHKSPRYHCFFRSRNVFGNRLLALWRVLETVFELELQNMIEKPIALRLRKGRHWRWRCVYGHDCSWGLVNDGFFAATRGYQ